MTGTEAWRASSSTSSWPKVRIKILQIVHRVGDSVHHPAQDLGRVMDRLAPAELGRLVREEEGVTTQLEGTHFEAYPGPSGALAEDHGQRLSGQGLASLLPALEPCGPGQEPVQFFPGKIRQREEVPLAVRHGVRCS